MNFWNWNWYRIGYCIFVVQMVFYWLAPTWVGAGLLAFSLGGQFVQAVAMTEQLNRGE